jgi:phage terminase Nu1 subunit (DNA packaging protein)
VSRLAHLSAVREPVVDLGSRRQRKDEQLKTKQEVAEHWSVHVRTVDRWVKAGMPVAERTWAGHPRFHLSACAEWHREKHQTR